MPGSVASGTPYIFNNSGNFWVPLVRVTNCSTGNIHTYSLLLLTLHTKQYLSTAWTPFASFILFLFLFLVQYCGPWISVQNSSASRRTWYTWRTDTREIKIWVCDKWVLVSNKKQEKTIARKVNGSIQRTDTVLYNTAEGKGKQCVLIRTSFIQGHRKRWTGFETAIT